MHSLVAKLRGRLVRLTLLPVLAIALGLVAFAALPACGSSGPSTPKPKPDGGGAGGMAGGGTGGTAGAGAESQGGTAGTGGIPCDDPQPETCDGVDNDCDGDIDNGDPGGGAICTTGLDGVCSTGIEHCIMGVVSCVPDYGPDELQEECNDLDDDCDGFIDEGLPTTAFYKDDDNDGYGTTASIQACKPTPGYSALSGDCNDNSPEIHPNAAEICNDIDDNCNSAVDEGVQKPAFFKDNDGDGWGGATLIFACTAPQGYVANAGDCNDFNKEIYPGAPEQCNNLDDDCDGPIDDNVVVQKIYKDNDGDGFAPVNAPSQDKCDVPVGWTTAKDVNGDSKPDWDCNDSDITSYPGAADVCDDGKDNDCDGYVDRLCYTSCGGSWPFKLTYSQGIQAARNVDLDGDGSHEIVVHDGYGSAILTSAGAALYQYSAPSYNYARAEPVTADIDDYASFSAAIQSLEVLTGNNSKPMYYKLEGGANVTVYAGGPSVYDASSFMAADVDNDGVVEFFASSWAEPSAGTKVFRFDKGTKAINQVVAIADPDGKPEYWDGRTLTDLDGDGKLDYVFSNGYPESTSPSIWAGKIYAYAFTNPTTLATQPFCNGCFDTAVAGLYAGGGSQLLRVGDELRVSMTYFTSNTPNFSNPSTVRYWAYDLLGAPKAGSPSTTSMLDNGLTDLDRDGKAEDLGAYVKLLGLFDVNGDGLPDRIYSAGTELRVGLYDAATKTFVEHVPSRRAIATVNVAVRSAWDIDGDSRLETIASDANGKVYCQRLGASTFARDTIVPPHFPPYLRTYQWDNYEPNEGTDTNNDGIPEEVVRIPSALTAKGEFYGFLSSASDKDYFLVDAAWGADTCVTAPKGYAYDLEVYSFYDKWNNGSHAAGADGKLDGLVWSDTGTANKKCFYGSLVFPTRNGEFKFVIGIKPGANGATPHWPYWVKATK